MGLDAKWSAGDIYMSEISAGLVVRYLQVNGEYCKGLPLNERIPLTGQADVFVTLRDAHHCPGAVIFVFELPPKTPKRQIIVHTGDFRYNASLMSSWIADIVGMVNIVYLDTTYLNKRFNFPPQADVLSWLARIANHLKAIDLENDSKTLCIVSTYNIGKEKVVQTLCDVLASNAIVETSKVERLVLAHSSVPFKTWSEFSGLESVYISDWTGVGTSPQEMFGRGGNPWTRFEALYEKVNSRIGSPGRPFTRLAAFHATGWTWSQKVRRAFQTNSMDPHLVSNDGRFMLYNIPYSEHSSYSEILEFLKAIKPVKIIPTVGDGEKQMKILDAFQDKKTLWRQAINKMFDVRTEGVKVEGVKDESTGMAAAELKTEVDIVAQGRLDPEVVSPAVSDVKSEIDARVSAAESRDHPTHEVICIESDPATPPATPRNATKRRRKGGNLESKQPKLTAFWQP
eukprot:Blabericola_migrator_1__4270@NODE_2308_length_2961_cov_146_284727_g1445_i0_p1_GENE_NODE_2308_length_2961_cov_146_284727_g1445_i0NODE_2308_length_2961_cov_146_284727_g1445_i0_p1_ORF_typecomplete_len456_score57_71DRMBL/PF07522_14/1_6e18Lactamase_B_2/PF12706_7/0_0003Lactamase_B_2/PF12706_7/8_8e03Lactamase_B_2/PF12706_7/2_9e02RMMBL/PF07521_12/0_00014_NODE_2308_length_2961_cov_146_284727_g1445_i09452312